MVRSSPSHALPPPRPADRADLWWRWAPKHPLRMRAIFRRCWLINLSMPPASLAAHLPAPVIPELHHGRAWLSVVVADMIDMRPVLAPAWAAVAFHQVVYRAVVQCKDRAAVFFLRTDANHRLYAWGGDLLTFFRFHHRPVSLRLDQGLADLQVDSPHAALSVQLDHQVDPDILAASPFQTVHNARPALVNRYHAVSVHPRGRLGQVTVQRPPWAIRAVGIRRATLQWAETHLPGYQTDSALYAENIPYVWSQYQPWPSS